jgi:hypothetical protein
VSTFTELFEQARVVIARSDALRTQSRDLVLSARRTRWQSGDLRQAAEARRERRASPRSADRSVRSFVVEGSVDGVAQTARWNPTDGLTCAPELLLRAQAVVAVGETFGGGRSSTATIQAGLQGHPTAVLLTVVRAFSTVTSISVDTPDAVDPPTAPPGEPPR